MTRYAIYFTPPQNSPLWGLGSSILGFDSASFTDVDYPDHPLFHDPAMLGWTAGPRRYGFHATLKAPFRLAPGMNAAALEAFGREFAAGRRPIETLLRVSTAGDFLSLVPVEPVSELNQLAEDCVRAFDSFRAPLTPEDRERRHPERLTGRQSEQLDRWGYPFVFEDFWYHMTLTGTLGADEQQRLAPVIKELFAMISPQLTIDAISICRQDEPEGRFRIQQRLPFGGG